MEKRLVQHSGRILLGFFLISVSLSWVLCGTGLCQPCPPDPVHFQFASNTGGTYSIVLQSISGACNIMQCDEIGIFDGELCVGASIYEGVLPLSLIAWQDDSQTPDTDGFQPGNSISFRLWRTDPDQEEDLVPTFTLGSGTFGDGPYSLVEVDCTQAEADLRLSKGVDPALVEVDDPVTFTVDVTNDGPGDATGVTVSDQLPAGYTDVDGNATVGSYDAGTGVWDIGSLANGATATLTVTATVAATGPYDNTAEVASSDQPDPDSTPDNGDAGEDDQDSAEPTVEQGCPADPVHFLFTSNTSGTYSIVLDGVNVDCLIEDCDEIGIFDGMLCVGASVFDGVWPLGLTV